MFYSNLCHQSWSLIRISRSTIFAPSFQKMCKYSTDYEDESIDVRSERDSNDAAPYLHPPLKEKFPQREPFVKNLFMGRFDKVLLEFPETLNKDRDELLHSILWPIEHFFNNEVDSVKIDQDSNISSETLQTLRNCGLFGMEVPLEHGGHGLCETEKSRLYEAIGLDSSINLMLAAHNELAVKTILLYGTEEQKKKYLPRLASGELSAAFALAEAKSGSNTIAIQSDAVLSTDEKTYTLNGEKVWVSNGGTADLFIVFARLKTLARKTELMDDYIGSKSSEDILNLGAFIVERDFGGVSSDVPLDTLGMKGANICGVHFENTSIPADNLIENKEEAMQMIFKIMGTTGSSMGAACVGSMKNLLRSTLDHAVNRKRFGKTLSEFYLIRKKFANMAIDTYVMESMVYYTAGLSDLLKDQDMLVESAIVKVFCSEKIFLHSSECLQIMGDSGLLEGSHHERHYRDSRMLEMFNVTTDMQKFFISMTSLQHVGISMIEDSENFKTRLFFPLYIAAQKWKLNRAMRGNVDINLLKDHLHPSLESYADWTDIAVKKLELTVVKVVSRGGKDLFELQLTHERLANVAIDLYAMVAVLSRSSRSYCIGFHNADHEVHIASCFCFEAKERIMETLDELWSEDIMYNADKTLDQIGKDIFEKKGYSANHPMTRIF